MCSKHCQLRRFLSILAISLVSLVIVPVALAATIYAGPQVWSTGQSGGSSFSSNWHGNDFTKASSADTTVTFIDNVTYGWHNTVRNSNTLTHTYWGTSDVKKGHCIAHVSGFSGSCYVYV
ncbi:MAG: hypothetical protein OEW56_04810 [Gemmatimonadota bacterium]|nr:hypothetical protein [Gemmatimonadota bacterium]